MAVVLDVAVVLNVIEPITHQTAPMIRNVVSTLLSQDEVIVTFTKKDGSERKMRCTTNLDLIPEAKRPVEKDFYDNSIVTENDQIRVFETELGEWRSFILKNLIKIEIVHKYQ